MKRHTTKILLRLTATLLLLMPFSSLGQQTDLAKAIAVISDEPSIDIRHAPQLQLSDSATTLRVQIGRTLLIKSPEPIKRISITDPAIATAASISPKEMVINGLSAGTVTLIIWDDKERARPFDLQVGFDVPGVQESLRHMFPTEAIQVTSSGKSLVLSGQVSSKTVIDQALALAQAQSTGVVNLLVLQGQASDTIMLQVRFAEVERSAIQELGVNLFSTGATNTIGSTSTQQFGQLGASVGAIPSSVQRGKDPSEPNIASGAIGNRNASTPAVFGLSDLLNVFLFRPDINLGAAIHALQQRNLLQILAEPNIMARNGTEANFLAGGEFPFPVLQGGAFQTVTIVFKEFGVRLRFLPTIQPDGTIRLKVQPEVSSLDFTNALTVSGFVVPALSTRRAETEVELRDGESFAIAGLIDNRTRELAAKIPVLGDVPVIGSLFKSRAQRKDNTELMVTVTPRLVRPVPANQAPTGPTFPKPFLNPDQFDGKTGEAQPAQGRRD